MATRYLTPADDGKPLSLFEFEHADGLEGYHYELIDGKLEVSPIPNLPHEEIKDRIADLFREYRRTRPEVVNQVKAPARVFVHDRAAATCPEPDIAAYHDYPLDRPIDALYWRDVSPLIVVEVIAADTADKDLTRNRELYLQVPSVQEYWIIDPRSDAARPTLTVYRRRGRHGTSWRRPITVRGGGTYTTRHLPDFTLVLDLQA
jgi:Uma2 family endonuclease